MVSSSEIRRRWQNFRYKTWFLIGHNITLVYLPSDFRVAYAGNISEHLTIRWEIDQHTGNYVPYSFRTVCGSFTFHWINYEELWDAAYGLSSLSEKSSHFADVISSTFSSVIWRPWVLVQQGFEPARLSGALPKWANRTYVRGSFLCEINGKTETNVVSCTLCKTITDH